MEIRETPEGLVISLRVRPNSPGFRLHESGLLEIKSPPREGRANMEIIKGLGRLFGTEARILRGHRGREKLVLLKNLREADIKD